MNRLDSLQAAIARLAAWPAAWLLAFGLSVAPAHAQQDAVVHGGEPPAVHDLATQPRPVVVPESARLLYDVTARLHGGDFHANAELRWQQDGEKYDAQLEIRALSLLLRSQSSSGTIGSEGLNPERFVDRTRSERVVLFDPEQQRITFSGNLPDVPLEPLAQDRLSVTLQLSSMLAGNPAAFPPGATLALQTAGPSSAEVWRFTVKGEATLPFSGAQLRTIKLERDPRQQGDQRVEVWFAPLLNYLPVRLKITQPGGDYVEQRLRAVEKP